MRVVNITLDPSMVDVPEGTEHTKTSWQIANFPNFNNQYHILYEELMSQVNLLSLTTNITDVHENALYYRVKFHFKNGGATEWIDPITLPSEAPVAPINMIAIPIVNAQLDYNNTIDGELVISTDPIKYFLGSGTHVNTDWNMIDEAKTSIINREADAVNLKEYRYPCSLLSDDKMYKIAVRHNGNNASSDYGRITLSTNIAEDNKYKLTKFSQFYADKPIYFNLKVNTTNFTALDLKATLSDDTEIAAVSNLRTLTPKITISNAYIGQTFIIKARIRLRDGSYSSWKSIFSGVLLDTMIIELDVDMKYLGKYDYSGTLENFGITAQSVFQLSDGSILLTRTNDNNVYRYGFINNELVQQGVAFTLPNTEDMDISYLNIQPRYDGSIIVNYTIINSDGTNQHSMFKTYSYNPITKVFTLEKSLTRDLEELSTAVSSSLFVGGSNTSYYVPAMESDGNGGFNKLGLYSLTYGLVQTAKFDLPFDAIAHVSLVALTKTKFLVLGGSDSFTMVDGIRVWKRTNNKIYVFDTTTITFTEVATIPESMSVDVYNIQGYLRKDNKVILFNAVHDGPELGNQNVLIFDHTAHTFEYQDIDMADKLPYRSTVLLRDGCFLRLTALPTRDQRVYNYISNTKQDYQTYTLSDAASVDLELIVEAGNTVIEENIYQYNKITIKGTSDEDTGRLIWQDGDIRREFDYKSFVITRDTTITSEEMEALLLRDVFVCGTANLTVIG